MVILGCYYRMTKDYKSMEKYYLDAMHLGSSDAAINMGLWYLENKNYEQMKKYLDVVTNKNNTRYKDGINTYLRYNYDPDYALKHHDILNEYNIDRY